MNFVKWYLAFTSMFAFFRFKGPFFVYFSIPIFIAFAAPANTCEQELSDKSDHFLKIYEQSLSKEGPSAVDIDWLDVVQIIFQIRKDDFLTLLPPELIQPKGDEHGQKIPKGMILLNSFAKSGVDEDMSFSKGRRISYKPSLLHKTSPESAEALIKGQRILLTAGAHNQAAFCVASSNFRVFHDKNQNSRMLTVNVDPKAKVIDLTENAPGKPTLFSHYLLFQWYVNQFVNKEIYKQFSSFKKLEKRIGKNKLKYLLGHVEAFGLLVGADIIHLSQKYGQVYQDEFWIINPTVVTSIQYAN